MRKFGDERSTHVPMPHTQLPIFLHLEYPIYGLLRSYNRSAPPHLTPRCSPLRYHWAAFHRSRGGQLRYTTTPVEGQPGHTFSIPW